MMGKLKVLTYGTCQGGAIAKFLNQSKEFIEKYEIVATVRYYEYLFAHKHFIRDGAYLPLIKDIDLLIYQPITNGLPDDLTENLLLLLKPDAISISIPYVYSTSLWPFVFTLKRDVTDRHENLDGDTFVRINVDSIDFLLKNGFDKKTILELFDNNQIDYFYEIRHRTEMNILANKEKSIDIKVHDYIKENLKDKRLFMYSSHPTSHLFVHMTNQILAKLNIEPIVDNFTMDFADISSPIPIAFPTSAIDYFKFNFTTKEEEIIGNNYYKQCITNYFSTI